MTDSLAHRLFWPPFASPTNKRCSCAGICELSKDPSTGKLTRIRLKLSTPLLQYRPRSDTVNTLLHEAIHAYFFITTSWKHARGDDGTGHGVGFQMLADAINNHGSYQITIFHTFHDEVDSFRTHVWQCNGSCKSQPPYFGLVKRSMNRPPGKSDNWFTRHEAECGGTYEKVQEPAPTKKQLDSMTAKERAGRQKNKLDGWFTAGSKRSVLSDVGSSSKPINMDDDDESSNGVPTVQKKASKRVVDDVVSLESYVSKKRARVDDDDDLVVNKTLLVECPICNLQVAESIINEHLDVVHA